MNRERFGHITLMSEESAVAAVRRALSDMLAPVPDSDSTALSPSSVGEGSVASECVAPV